jgi:TetR/AcrR family transcriptional repressor of nem operon
MAARGREGDGGTATAILDVAERLVQRRGFNGFSYADAAAELAITKAALHYHFPGKAELGEALVVRYAARFAAALEAVDEEIAEAPRKLEAYAALYLEVLRAERVCLCGMLAAEYQTLPKSMQDAVGRFFDENEAWLGAVLEQGRAAGTLEFSGEASDVARMIIGTLEGAMLVARLYGDLGRFEATAARVLAGLTVSGGREKRPPRTRATPDGRRPSRR